MIKNKNIKKPIVSLEKVNKIKQVLCSFKTPSVYKNNSASLVKPIHIKGC